MKLNEMLKPGEMNKTEPVVALLEYGLILEQADDRTRISALVASAKPSELRPPPRWGLND